MPDAERASEVKLERVEWLWRERIPRALLSIIGGRPDEGKGLVVSRMAADVSRMQVRDWMTGEMRPASVLVSAAEDSRSLMTAPRLLAAGANMKRVHLWEFVLPLMFTELAGRVINDKIDLVVMDPMAAHLSGGVNRQSDSIRQVTGPLKELMDKTGVSIVVIEHVLKRTTRNTHPLAALGGSSSGIVAASRMAFILGTHDRDGDRRILAAVKHNICDEPQALAFDVDTKMIELPDGDLEEYPFLLYGEELDYPPSRLLDPGTSGRPGRPAEKKAAAAEWLAKYLFAAGKPVKSTDVFEDAKQYNHTTKTLRRAAKDLEVVKDPPTGPNVKWSLPDELTQMMKNAPQFDTPDGPPPTEDDVDGEGRMSDEDIQKWLSGGPSDDDEKKDDDDGEGDDE